MSGDVEMCELRHTGRAWGAGLCWRGVTKSLRPGKILVENNTGSVCGGELLAVMGPSGGGKTTLLTILGGRDRTTCSGSLFLHGQHVSLGGRSRPFTKHLKRCVGFVPQDDCFLDALTVEEHLMFSVELRSETTDGHGQRVSNVLNDLNLAHCAKKLIRVISGGERKRCSIAAELLADPSVLILDEATSGLDSAVATALLHNLRSLAHCGSVSAWAEGKEEELAPMTAQSSGRLAVIMSIHQPSSGIFYCFHKVMFVAEGRVAYYGSTTDLVGALAIQGYQLPSRQGPRSALAYNPADYMIELLYSTCCQSTEAIEAATGQQMGVGTRYESRFAGCWPRYILMDLYDKNFAEAEVEREVRRYESLQAIYPSLRVRACDVARMSILAELRVLLRRSVKCSNRSSSLSVLSIAEALFMATLAGLSWFQTELRESTVSNYSGLLFFLCAYWFFAGLYTGLLDFLPERLVLRKDVAAGAYRLVTYFLSRTAGSFPARVILPTVFAVVAGLLAMYPVSYGLGSLAALLVLTALTGEALGVFLGIASNNLDRSVTVANVIALSTTIFGGFYTKNLPSFMRWLSRLSVLRYCFDALCQSQFPADRRVECDGGGLFIAQCVGEQYISGMDIRRWLRVEAIPLSGNIGAIVGIYLALKFAGYAALLATM